MPTAPSFWPWPSCLQKAWAGFLDDRTESVCDFTSVENCWFYWTGTRKVKGLPEIWSRGRERTYPTAAIESENWELLHAPMYDVASVNHYTHSIDSSFLRAMKEFPATQIRFWPTAPLLSSFDRRDEGLFHKIWLIVNQRKSDKRLSEIRNIMFLKNLPRVWSLLITLIIGWAIEETICGFSSIYIDNCRTRRKEYARILVDACYTGSALSLWYLIIRSCDSRFLIMILDFLSLPLVHPAPFYHISVMSWNAILIRFPIKTWSSSLQNDESLCWLEYTNQDLLTDYTYDHSGTECSNWIRSHWRHRTSITQYYPSVYLFDIYVCVYLTYMYIWPVYIYTYLYNMHK